MAENRKNDGYAREEIFSKAVRAGKRTYFFDVKATRRNDFYLTVTESKKRFDPNGRFHFEKHKLFLYKEDFEKFIQGLEEVIEFIKVNNAPIEGDTEEGFEQEHEDEELDEISSLIGQDDTDGISDFADVDFDDLEDKN